MATSGQGSFYKRSRNLLAICLIFSFILSQHVIYGGDDIFAVKINKITENLDKAVLGLTNSVEYIEYNDTPKYVSETNFTAKGMSGFYNFTKLFINKIAPDDILVKGAITIKNNQIYTNIPAALPKILLNYRGVLGTVAFLLVCAILFPLCGLFFCYCRCCGNCGGRSQPADKKKDLCKKIFHGTLLILLGTALLFCVVCAFVSNQQFQNGVKELPANMRNTVKDTHTYLDSISKQIRHLLGDNYQQFDIVFRRVLAQSSAIVRGQLDNYSNATAVLQLYDFAENTEKINESLWDLKSNSNRLRVYASQLNDALRQVKKELLITLNNCDLQQCKEIQKNISSLQTNIDFNSYVDRYFPRLPDVTEAITSLNDLPMIEEIRPAVEQGKKKLDDIKHKIAEGLFHGLNEATERLDKCSRLIYIGLSEITSSIENIRANIDNTVPPLIEKTQSYLTEYNMYGYYVGLGISCTLLLVSICIVLGLMCGICGKRPDGYTDNCCNKGAGSQFLLCAVIIMFLFGCVISAVSIIGLLFGVASEKGVCTSLRNPNPKESQLIYLIDKYNFKMKGVTIKPSQFLLNCHKNKSIYHLVDISNRLNITNMRQDFDVRKQLNTFNINNSIPMDFTIIDQRNMRSLEKLLEFHPDVDFDQFTYELSANFTNYSLLELSERLEEIVKKLEDPDTDDIRASLQLSILHLNTYNEKLVKPMKNLANRVMENAVKLGNDLKMNKSSFNEAVRILIDEIKGAQEYLIKNGTTQLNTITEDFKGVIISLIESYVNRFDYYLTQRIGQCGPFSKTINATLTSTCDKILMPWNGFWFTLFLTVILYIFTIIISVKLANLYQKYKPYGQYIEAEYLYEAYAERSDNIPLNNRNHVRNKKKKTKKSKKYEERSAQTVQHEAVAREYAAGSHPSGGRYSDMAPKHWEEFPSGTGPPQYQRAPTEYERPPPYYYPGNGGEQ